VGYPLDLDEIDEARLVYELDRRRKLRSQHRCDYCERAWGVLPVCKFPHRHLGEYHEEVDE
jgi:hypothetical protein